MARFVVSIVRTALISQIFVLSLAVVLSVPDDMGNAISLNLTSKYPLQLKYLGAIGRKAYFADLDLVTNWTGAAAYCQSFDLRLISIETESERSFIIDAILKYGTGLPSYYIEFWTSARESRQPSMMVWNTTGRQPNMSLLRSWTFYPTHAFEYCGTFLIQHNRSRCFTVDCSDARYRVLCEADT